MNIRTLSRNALCVLLLSTLLMDAHSERDNGVMRLTENRRPTERRILQIPDIGGFETLKCDLHMHTVFSDGLVWPTIRVQEAWEEGLDAISITDHVEYQPHRKDIPSNHNRPYELALDRAAEANLILIKGNELTRTTPPGHFNAIFIGDSSDYIGERGTSIPDHDLQAINKAADQNAFIFWNHPGWKVDQIEGTYEWIPFVERLLQEDKLHGIEVINEFTFHRKSLDWALEHNLTILGTSDIHNLIAHHYDMERGATRSMSLLFVKERSPEGIREALEAGRSVAWSTKILAGKEEWIRALYDASVSVDPIHATDRKGFSYREISNNSDLSFDLKRLDPELTDWPESITLPPQSRQVLKIAAGADAKPATYSVTNAFIGGYTNLLVELP